MEEADRTHLNQLIRAASPGSVKGDRLTKALKELYDFVARFNPSTKEANPKFDKLWKRPDGSRAFQLLFRRGDENLRNQLIDDFSTILFDVATLRYSYHIVISMIKNSNSVQRNRIFTIFKGNFDKLLLHKIGARVIDALYQNTNQQQKLLMYLDFYGEYWKKQKEPMTLADISKQDKAGKAVENLRNNLEHIIGKNGHLKLTHNLLLILGQVSPAKLGTLAYEFSKYCFSCNGSQAAIIAIQNAQPNDIKSGLSIIEPNLRKSVFGGSAPNVAAPEESAVAEEEEEEEMFEEGENFNEEGENYNEDGENYNEEGGNYGEAEIDSSSVQTNNTTQLALDNFAWRALSCAISYNTDLAVIQNEVLPNLLDYWDVLCTNKNALQLLLRLISIQPSVFHDLTFQKPELNQEVKQFVMTHIHQLVLNSIPTLSLLPEGSRFFATYMAELVQDPSFGPLAEIVFTKENVVDKVAHKLIRMCVKVVGKEAADLALDTINEIGVGEVLKTPGAWIIKELLTDHPNKKFENKVKAAIKDQKIEGPAIESILGSNDKPAKPKKKGKGK